MDVWNVREDKSVDGWRAQGQCKCSWKGVRVGDAVCTQRLLF